MSAFPASGRPLLIVYVVAAAANIAGQILAAQTLMAASKPLLMPLLIAWVWQVARRPLEKPTRLLLAGLVFAWLGDLFLMGEGDVWFIAGIGGFLVMQVLYILAYRSIPGPSLIRQRLVLLIPFIVFWAGMNLLMDPGVLRIPVLLYSVVLVGMGVAAVDLMGRFPGPYAGRVALGAILFIVSDALIALDNFSGLDIGRWQGVLVMSTYTVAQFLIVTGFVEGQRAATPP